jgi:hypothetical protein
VNAEVDAAVENLKRVQAETNSAMIFHNQILDSVQSLRTKFT